MRLIANTFNCHENETPDNEDPLLTLLKRQYEVEVDQYKEPVKITKAELDADKFLEDGLFFHSGWAQAPVIWKSRSQPPELVKNYKQALRMSIAIDSQMSKRPKIVQDD